MSDREKLVEVMARAMSEADESRCLSYAEIATAALAAIEAAGVRMVPVEATLEMRYAGEARMADADVALINRKKRGEAPASETVLDTLYSGDVYAAMLSASPFSAEKETGHE